MVLPWQQLPPVFIWKARWRTRIVATLSSHMFVCDLPVALSLQTNTARGNAQTQERSEDKDMNEQCVGGTQTPRRH